MIIPGSALLIDDYHSSDHVSNSKLQAFDALGPGGYFGRYIGRTDTQPDTPAFRMGRLGEDAVCHRDLPPMVPEMMTDPAPVPKAWSMRRKTCKEWSAANPNTEPPEMLADPAPEPAPWGGNRTVCKQWLADNPDAITPSESKLLERLRAAVDGNPTARSVIDSAEEQLSLRGAWPGLPGIQARPDWLVIDHQLLGDVNLDLKTTDSLEKFKRSVDGFGYNRQAGFVDLLGSQCGLNLSHYLLAVEKSYPYRAQLYELSDRTIATGRRWVERKLTELAGHYMADHWPATVSDVESLDAPVWGMDMESENAA